MSDVIKEAADKLRSKVGADGFDGSIKFLIEDEGAIVLNENGVSEGESDAECTITGSMDTFREMFEGDLEPTTAFMTGRIKIDGEMSVAMKLAQLFG